MTLVTDPVLRSVLHGGRPPLWVPDGKSYPPDPDTLLKVVGNKVVALFSMPQYEYRLLGRASDGHLVVFAGRLVGSRIWDAEGRCNYRHKWVCRDFVRS